MRILEANLELGPELEPVMIRCRTCLDQALVQLNNLPPEWHLQANDRLRAQTLNSYLLDAVANEFEGDADAEYHVDRQLGLLTVPGAQIRFNKVNRRGRLASNGTVRTQEWLALPLPGQDVTRPLWFVYRPDALWVDIEFAQLQLRWGKVMVSGMDIQRVDPPAGQDNEKADGVTELPRLYTIKPIVRRQRQKELFDADATDSAEGAS